jgi:hypothetical protein
VTLLSFRSGCLWNLGYPAAARNDAERALDEAREIGQAATLMYALWWASWTHILNGTYAAAQPLLDELAALADEKDAALFWKAAEIAFRGALFALTGNASDAVRAITSGITSLQSTGATLYEPWHLSAQRSGRATGLGNFPIAIHHAGAVGSSRLRQVVLRANRSLSR